MRFRFRNSNPSLQIRLLHSLNFPLFREKQSRNNGNNVVFDEDWRPDTRWVSLFVAPTLIDTMF